MLLLVSYIYYIYTSNGCVKSRCTKEHRWIETLDCLAATRTSKRGCPIGAPFQYHIEQHDDYLSTTSPILLPPRGEGWKLDELWRSPG